MHRMEVSFLNPPTTKTSGEENNMRTGSPLPTGPYYFRISYGSVLEKVEDGWLYIFN